MKKETKLGQGIIEGLKDLIKSEKKKHKNYPDRFVEENWGLIKESHKIKDLRAKANRSMSRKRHLRKLNKEQEKWILKVKENLFWEKKYRKALITERRKNEELKEKIEKLKSKKHWWKI